jgi:hypothetical protein
MPFLVGLEVSQPCNRNPVSQNLSITDTELLEAVITLLMIPL